MLNLKLLSKDHVLAKKIILLAAFSALAATGSSQTFKAVFLNPNVYRTKANIEATRILDVNGNKFNDKVTIDVEGGFMDYKIVSEDENGHIIIRILPRVTLETYNTAQGPKLRVRRWLTTDANDASKLDGYNYYYAIKEDEFPPLGKTLLSTKIVGVPLVHPFKLRPNIKNAGWDLNQEFTVSYSFGIRFKTGSNPFKRNYLTIIPLGFGIGEDKYFRNVGDEKEDAISITYYQAGILRTWNKINLGAFISFDAMIDRKNDWFYQAKPWYSFGIGYKFNED